MDRPPLRRPVPLTVDDVRVTDFHVHIQPWRMLSDGARETMAAPRAHTDAADIGQYQEDPEAFVKALDAWGVDRAMLINYVAPETMGFTAAVNDWVADYASGHRDRLVPVGSVHPRHVGGPAEARAEVERLAATLEIPMLKLHPAHQAVWPDAYRGDSRGHRGHPPDGRPYGDALEAMYESCIDHDVRLMVHTGTSVFPGARNPPCDPMLLDDVAVDHPKLQIVMAHAGRPLWGEEACFVARRHPNVWLDLSGIPPARLGHYVPALRRLADKCLWGTDWPGPGLPADALRTNVEAFLAADLGLDDEAKRAILDGNSRRLLP